MDRHGAKLEVANKPLGVIKMGFQTLMFGLLTCAILHISTLPWPKYQHYWCCVQQYCIVECSVVGFCNKFNKDGSKVQHIYSLNINSNCVQPSDFTFDLETDGY